MVNNYDLLKFTRFKATRQWDPNYFFNTEVTSRYKVSRLGDHISRETKKRKLYESPNESFGILGISNSKGMFDSYNEYGKNINQSYIKVENGYISYNPYRINVGSVGLKTNKLKNEYISPAYIVFSCKSTLLPEYLFMLMKTDKFNLLIRENVVGAVRQTLSFNKFKEIKIPIPNIAEQQKLINNYFKSFELANNYIQESLLLRGRIEECLFAELGITDNNSLKLNENLLRTVPLSKCDRWSIDYLLNKDNLQFLYTSKYDLVQARDFIDFCQYGLSEKATSEKQKFPILRMNNIQDSELDTSHMKYISYKNNVEKYTLNIDDLLFNRTNSKELVGKAAIFSLEGKYVFASYIIRVVLNKDIVDVNYINFLFSSKIIRAQIDLISRQVLGQANINAEELKNFLFPLPPLNKQKEIAKKISSIKEEIKNNVAKSETIICDAKDQFSKDVFAS